uniref:Putative presenilins associated rhomboid like mitochondrial isoform x1 n=1 Tax=Ixodes scapularis TaxID=6945 RepID=A0A4D5RG47_IXOSC
MVRYFSSNPASRSVCLPMLLSTFSHSFPGAPVCQHAGADQLCTSGCGTLGQGTVCGYVPECWCVVFLCQLSSQGGNKAASDVLGSVWSHPGRDCSHVRPVSGCPAGHHLPAFLHLLCRNGFESDSDHGCGRHPPQVAAPGSCGTFGWLHLWHSVHSLWARGLEEERGGDEDLA